MPGSWETLLQEVVRARKKVEFFSCHLAPNLLICTHKLKNCPGLASLLGRENRRTDDSTTQSDGVTMRSNILKNWVLGSLSLAVGCLVAPAAQYITDFNGGLPSGSATAGNSFVDSSGGVGGSGVLQR